MSVMGKCAIIWYDKMKRMVLVMEEVKINYKNEVTGKFISQEHYTKKGIKHFRKKWGK